MDNLETIFKGTTPKFSAPLLDEDGDGIAAAAVASFTARLYDKTSGEVINSRSAVDLWDGGNWTSADGMKATVDASGNCTVRLAAEDCVMHDSTKAGEIHVLRVTVVSTGADPTTLVEEIEFYLKNYT
jgi:hypothetical protein